MTKPDRRFKIPALYKKLLLLAIVVGPMYWLMFTEDGRRRTDLVALSLAGDPSVELRLDILASAATEDEFRQFLPDAEWQCKNAHSPFGERSCVSPIASFNDAPSHYLVLYFENNALQAMKVVYRRGYHDWLVTLVKEMLGAPSPGSRNVLQWDTGKGLVLMQTQLAEQDGEPTLMWLSLERARERAASVRP
jgi:hypothetical protein